MPMPSPRKPKTKSPRRFKPSDLHLDNVRYALEKLKAAELLYRDANLDLLDACGEARGDKEHEQLEAIERACQESDAQVSRLPDLSWLQRPPSNWRTE
jgi:hypothetical protein